ncbi:MAG TPA: enoyl-CoA hydratase [Pseudonocardia sp.]|nr:enoyl-CoA hydratase [Pseudonocardia sp.]
MSSTMTSLRWEDQVALITIRRPDKRNALNFELCTELIDVVSGVLDEGARVLVFTGEGSSFCSGADLDTVYTPEFRGALYRLLGLVTNAPVPVIAAVNGPAIGAGTQLAIAADLRVVTPSAAFAVPTAKLGLAVDPWTVRRLALLVGNAPARSMLLACEQVSAEDALRFGLAQRMGSPNEAVTWARTLAELAPLTLAYNKKVLNAAFEPEFDPTDAVGKELYDAFEACWDSEDFAEARQARAEKRHPKFTGR